MKNANIDAMADADLARIKAACATLSEYFDAVQIFASRCESGEADGTLNYNFGAGNWFTRYGHVLDWCTEQDEYQRARARGRYEGGED